MPTSHMTLPQSCVIQSDLAFWFWSVLRKVCDGAVFISMPSHMRGSLSGDAPVPNYRNRVMHVCLPYSSYIGRLMDLHSSPIWHMFPVSWGKKMHLCSFLRFLIVTLKTCQGESLLVCLHQFAFYVSVSLKWPQESDHHWGFSSLFFPPKIQDVNALISSKSAFCELIYYTFIKKCSQRLFFSCLCKTFTKIWEASWKSY